MSRDFTTNENSIRRLGAGSRARRDGGSPSSAVQAALASFADVPSVFARSLLAPTMFALSLLTTTLLPTSVPHGTVSAQEQNSKKSGANRADAKKSDSSKSETSKSETSKSETSKPETSKPDSSKSSATKSDATKPEANKQSSTKSDANKADVDKTDASKQDVSKASESRQAAKEATGKLGPKAKAAAKVDAAKAGAAVGVTPEREAAVMKFVEQHHPELGTLLVRLKDGDRKEYDRAVRDLFRVSERLAQTHERDQSRYELELRAWQVQSRIDLLTARMRMSGGEELKSQLRQTLLEQHQIKQQLLQFERDRVAERLQKLDEQLKGIEQSREDIVEKQLRLLSGEKKK